jgi:hypothetical protein
MSHHKVAVIQVWVANQGLEIHALVWELWFMLTLASGTEFCMWPEKCVTKTIQIQNSILCKACDRVRFTSPDMGNDTYHCITVQLPVQILLFGPKRGILLSLTRIPLVKAFPIHAWTGSLGSRRQTLPEFLDNRQMKVARLPALRTGHFPPRRYTWYSFLLEAELIPGPYGGRKD